MQQRHYLLSALLSFLCVFSTSVSAGISYSLDDFERTKVGLDAGPVVVGDDTFFKLGLSPNLEFGPLEIGFDLNVYLGDGDKPDDLDTFALRRLAYTHNDTAGIEWGHLRNVTMGYGLLVDGYDSGSFGSDQFTTDKAGAKGFVRISDLRVDALYTASKVMMGRLEYTLDDSFILGSPLVVGATYVNDDDGVNETYDGNSISRAAQTAYGVDIGLPVAGDFMTVYAEYAKLDNELDGQGASIGLKGAFFEQATYRAEYRQLGTGFVPGYFDELYEATSLDSADVPNEQISGFLLGADYNFNNFIRAGAQYEAYSGHDPILTGALGFKRIGNVQAVANYTQSFNGEDSAVLNSDIVYYASNGLNYLIKFKRVFHPNGNDVDTYSVGLKTDLASLF